MTELQAASRRSFWIAPCVVLALAVIPYLGILRTGYVFDDVKLVQENPRLRAGWSEWGSLIETFDITSRKWDNEELRANYRPLRFLSYWIDARLSEVFFGPIPATGPPVFFFHLTNVLLHALNALLVLGIGRRLGLALAGDRDSRAAIASTVGLASAVLFAVHPLQTEAVTYISGRRDVLSAFFFLSAVLVHLRVEGKDPPGVGTILAVAGLMILGLLTKESAVTLVGALILLDLARSARLSFRRLALHGLTCGLAAVFIWITLSNERLLAAPGPAGGGSQALTAPRYLLRYLGLVLFPVSQSIDYSFDAIPESTSILAPWTTLPAFLVVVAALLLGAWLLLTAARRKLDPPSRAVVPLAMFWFLGMLVPVLQLVPIAEKFAERFTYLASLGVFLAGGVLLARLRSRDAILGSAAIGLLALLGLGASFRRNGDWQSPLQLWSAAARAQPRAARARLGHANALKDAGLFREAAAEYTAALAIFEEKPDLPLHHGFILQALTFRGAVRGDLSREDAGLLDGAIQDYQRVLGLRDTDGVEIRSSPRHAVLHLDLAALLYRKGDVGGAVAAFERVVELVPALPLARRARYSLAKLAQARRDLPAARKYLSEVLAACPAGDPERAPVAIELADLLIEEKSLDEAARLVAEELGQPGARGQLRHHLQQREAKILDRKGDLVGCVAVLEKILLEDPAYGPALLTLAGIEAAQSKLDQAEKRYQALLAVEPSNPQAAEGLQNVRLLRRINEGKTGQGAGQENPGPLLEAMEKKGVESLARGEILAAREVFSKLLVRATDARRTDVQCSALRGLARVEELLGHFQAAGDGLRKALELDPRDAASLRQLGDLSLRSLGDPAAARRWYEQSLEAIPVGQAPDPRVLLNLAEILGGQDPLAALAHLERARAVGYKDPTLDRALGYRLADLGRWQQSLDAFNRYLEATPLFESPGKEDRRRQAAKDFVNTTVLPNLTGALSPGTEPGSREGAR